MTICVTIVYEAYEKQIQSPIVGKCAAIYVLLESSFVHLNDYGYNVHRPPMGPS